LKREAVSNYGLEMWKQRDSFVIGTATDTGWYVQITLYDSTGRYARKYPSPEEASLHLEILGFLAAADCVESMMAPEAHHEACFQFLLPEGQNLLYIVDFGYGYNTLPDLVNTGEASHKPRHRLDILRNVPAARATLRYGH